MRTARGDYTIAAKLLGMNPVKLRNRVANDPHLRACFIHSSDRVRDVTVEEADLRKPKDIPIPVATRAERHELPEVESNRSLANIITAQDRELMRVGLAKTGISQSTIDKLKLFETFSEDSGKFLVLSMDMTHRMMIYQVTALFEEGEKIRATYLANDTCPPEERIEWQKAYNEISELLMKSYDRTLAGTQAMVNIMRTQAQDKGQGTKRKPKFEVKVKGEVKDGDA